MTNLTRKEIIYLHSLVATSNKGLLPMDYCFYDYQEWTICINKDNKIWQVYLCERGNKYDLETFEDIKDACIRVIWNCSYNKEEIEPAIQNFLIEVANGYSLSDEKINEFKNRYLNDLYTSKNIRVRKK